MRKLLLVLLAVTFSVGLIASMSYACGDKFLVSSRQMTEAQMNTHAGVILIYRNLQYPQTAAVFDKKLTKSLENRGHTVKVVENTEDMKKEMEKGKIDLVMLTEEDAKVMGAQTEHPMIMPVVLNADFAQVQALRDIYGAVLNGDAKTNKKTKEIDEAMKEVK